MAQIIKLKRSLTAGSKPTTSNLGEGELAMNVTDGKLFLRKSGSAGDNVKEIVTLDHAGTLSGSLNLTGSITASAFKPFSSKTNAGNKDFNYGSIMIPVSKQQLSSSDVYEIVIITT